MVAYLIFVKERTHNQGELDLYREMAPAALAGHPITFRIPHGHKEVVEGPDFEDMMMPEFPTFREARAWYDSPAYQEASEHRFKGAAYRAIIVEGALLRTSRRPHQSIMIAKPETFRSCYSTVLG